MTTDPEPTRRGPAEPASPDQLPEPVEPDADVSMPPLLPPLLRKRPRVNPYTAHYSRVQRRRDKITAEIERNRRGEAAIPTWVLALILVVIIAGFAALVIFS